MFRLRFLCKRKISQIREECSNPETGDILKIIAKEWKNLSEQQKRIYNELGANDKEAKIRKLKKLNQEEAWSNVLIFVEDLRVGDKVEVENNEDEAEVNQPAKGKVMMINIFKLN